MKNGEVMSNFHENDEHYYMSTENLQQRYGKSKMTLWRWQRKIPDFPQPLIISGRRYWPRNEILAWEERCAENRTQKPGREVNATTEAERAA